MMLEAMTMGPKHGNNGKGGKISGGGEVAAKMKSCLQLNNQ